MTETKTGGQGTQEERTEIGASVTEEDRYLSALEAPLQSAGVEF